MKKKKRGGRKKKMTAEQSIAFKSVYEWVYLDHTHNHKNNNDEEEVEETGDGFALQKQRSIVTACGGKDRIVFEFHSHSKFSDGSLSPSKVVERAHLNGVKVLAITDHDTLSGIPEAVEAAQKYGIKIIPGVEISTMFSSRNLAVEEPVHILAYYSSCGPMKFEELEKFLGNIRDGRYVRAKEMVLKLNKLKLPIKWEQVARIAGKGIAPGRLHIARAMVEAGHVENVKQAFSRYLYDGGPAYSMGAEPDSEEAIRMICDTGGVAVLAHPWALKNPAAIIKRLKKVGLHGVEVYRSDGKLDVYSNQADANELLKLGGSDYHGRKGQNESELGSVNLPVSALNSFLEVARPIWCNAIREILTSYSKEPSNVKLARMMKFGRTRMVKGTCCVSNSVKDLINCYLSSWLSYDEQQNGEFENILMKLSDVPLNENAVVPV